AGEARTGATGERKRDRSQQPEQLEAAPAMPDGQASQLLGKDAAHAAERLADELADPEADHHRPTRHRGIGEPALVPAVNSRGNVAAARTRRLVGLGSGANAHRALFI